MSWETIREAIPIEGKKITMMTVEADRAAIIEKLPDAPEGIWFLYLHLDDGHTMTIPVMRGIGVAYDGFTTCDVCGEVVAKDSIKVDGKDFCSETCREKWDQGKREEPDGE